MRIRYVGHATLSIETGNCTIVTDPWTNGPAFCKTWYIFPKPVKDALPKRIDYILISHGHEDHLHEPTLELLPKAATVFYPYFWYSNSRNHFSSLGFKRSYEAVTDKRYRLEEDVYVTFIGHNLDSIVVVEAGGKVLVNVNDALHAYDLPAIEYFTSHIKRKWSNIDYVFCGFGGASNFPNTIHLPGKNDIDVAAARELLYLRNFCEIVSRLEPKIGVPFAADFVLLSPEHRWINQTRIPRGKIAEIYQKEYRRAGSETVVHDMYSGDFIDGYRFEAASPYRAEMVGGSLNHLIEAQYGDELREHDTIVLIEESDAEQLEREILDNVKTRLKYVPSQKRVRLKFAIKIKDVISRQYYLVDVRTDEPIVVRSDRADADCILEMEILSTTLRYSFGSDWGGDALFGYGANTHVRFMDTVLDNLDICCFNLLTRHPRDAEYLKRPSWRSFKFIYQNPVYRDRVIKRVMRRTDTLASQLYGQSNMYDRELWLTRNKCEICQVCSLTKFEPATASQQNPSFS